MSWKQGNANNGRLEHITSSPWQQKILRIFLIQYFSILNYLWLTHPGEGQDVQNARNISSVISDHLIQFLIEPSSTHQKLEETCKLQRCYKNFDKTKFKNGLNKFKWKQHCSSLDSNVALETTIQTNSIHNVKTSLLIYWM